MGLNTLEITLDKPRQLRFTFNALCVLEDTLGRPLGDVLGALRRLNARDFRAVLWAGLRHEDPALTPEGAGDLVTGWLDGGGDYLVLYDQVDRALVRSGILGKAAKEREAETAQGNASAPPPAIPSDSR